MIWGRVAAAIKNKNIFAAAIRLLIVRQIASALFAVLLVGIAFFGSYEGMRHATQDRYNTIGAVAAGNQTKAAPEEDKEHSTNRDFFGPEWFLVWVSAALATVTAFLFWATNRLATDTRLASAKALEASSQHTATLVNIERAYLVGGGQVTVAGKTFQLEFSNYGKTPAFIYAFDVEFTTLQEVQAGPQEVFPMFFFEDVVPPGGAGPHPQKKQQIKITAPNADVAYGAVWYEDWQKRVHIFRFILRIVPGISWNGSTFTSVPGVDPSYMYRD